MEDEDVSDEDSTFEDVRFDPNRDRDVGFFSDNCSPESEEEKFMCDYPLPRGSFWSGSLTTNTTNPSIDVWVMVSSNSFSSSLWYMDGKISRKPTADIKEKNIFFAPKKFNRDKTRHFVN